MVPTVQWFDGDGFADLLRSTSLYRRLDSNIREPLFDAIAERIRTQIGNQASRGYLSVLLSDGAPTDSSTAGRPGRG